jgi:S1-C subfamily serine protease
MRALLLFCAFASIARADEDAATKLSERAGPSVVRVASVVAGEDAGGGTAFFVDARGIVATNHHVLDGLARSGGDLLAVLRDGKRVKILGSLADDEPHDLALLRIEGDNYPVLPLAPSETVRAGEPIMLIGSPFGLDQSVGTGLLSAVRPDFPPEWKKSHAEDKTAQGPLVQHNIALGPGSSGSPLLDSETRVVGVNHSFIPGTDVCFGAHVDALRALIAKTDLAAKPKPIGHTRRNLIISAIFFGSVLLVLVVAGLASRRRRPTTVRH